jgi:hypothetical protein
MAEAAKTAQRIRVDEPKKGLAGLYKAATQENLAAPQVSSPPGSDAFDARVTIAGVSVALERGPLAVCRSYPLSLHDDTSSEPFYSP